MIKSEDLNPGKLYKTMDGYGLLREGMHGVIEFELDEVILFIGMTKENGDFVWRFVTPYGVLYDSCKLLNVKFDLIEHD